MDADRGAAQHAGKCSAKTHKTVCPPLRRKRPTGRHDRPGQGCAGDGEADAGVATADGDVVAASGDGATGPIAAGAADGDDDGDGDGEGASSVGLSTRRPQANAAFQ